MAVEKSHTRLGLFLVVALVIFLATALLFIQRLRSREVIAMVTYTRENVSGLDISSPVRYRGVPVGRVTEVQVDPRAITIEIDFELFLDRLTTIGANVKRIQHLADLGGMVPKLRAQVVANPVTGEAYLLLDLPENPPPPIELGFTPDRPYVASMPSAFAKLQDRLPEVLDRAELTLQTLREIISRIPDSLDRSDRFFTNVERIIRESELQALSADSRKFFTATSAQIAQITAEMDGVFGTEGTLVKLSDEARAAIKAADLPAVTRSARDAADNSKLAADDLRRSLPVIRDSLEQLRDLARQLEEQPESVVYGPRPPKGKPR
jgi:paraquat-inducible protein B